MRAILALQSRLENIYLQNARIPPMSVVQSIDDLSVILSVCSLIFCLSIIGYSLLSTLFSNKNVEGQELEVVSIATT